MTFPTDPLLAEMTIRALSNPASVDRDRLLDLVDAAGLRGSAVWDQVAAQPPGWMQVGADVVKMLIARAQA